MAYKILNSEVRGEILSTLVQYDFLQEPIEILHFQPKTSEEVLLNIENREESEQVKLNSLAINESIKNELDGVLNVDSAVLKNFISIARTKLNVDI